MMPHANTLQSTLLATLLTAGLSVHAAAPAAPAGAEHPAVVSDQADSTKTRFLDMESSVPKSWLTEPPASSMRLLQYRVSSAEDGLDAQFVLFFFGGGGGGSAQENIERWSSQFLPVDGKPVQPRVGQIQINGMTATTAELKGTYARGIGMGPVGEARPDQTLLAAVVESPEGNLIIQLWGPSATVDANREGFLTFIKSIHKVKPR